jgi:hypothetical protein
MLSQYDGSGQMLRLAPEREVDLRNLVLEVGVDQSTALTILQVADPTSYAKLVLPVAHIRFSVAAVLG